MSLSGVKNMPVTRAVTRALATFYKEAHGKSKPGYHPVSTKGYRKPVP